jgi:putative transposase
MADEEIQTPWAETAEVEQAAPKRTPKVRGTNAAKAVSPISAKPKIRSLSDQEKLERIGQIDVQVAGGETLKSAVKRAGISDQTYYQWKKATAQAPEPSVSDDDEFVDFIQLEEENRQLRKLLSEKLRAENAELRKRLGMT